MLRGVEDRRVYDYDLTLSGAYKVAALDVMNKIRTLDTFSGWAGSREE